MLTDIFTWYFIGLILSIPLLLITNTIAVKFNEDKAELKYILISWIYILMAIIFIIYILLNKYKPISNIVKFFNQEPDLLKKKK